MKKVLITGGCGFIGSHTALAFLEMGVDVVVLDNLSNSHHTTLDGMAKICQKPINFVKGDILDEAVLSDIFTNNKIDAVIHFAGLKSVSESVTHPLQYFKNNVQGTITLLKAMQKANVFHLIFSSSATVYGDQSNLAIDEDCVLNEPNNPYGRSKRMVEEILQDLARSDTRWKFAILRYFNPVGAHKSGLIGESPLGTPNNLLPLVCEVALKKTPFMKVFGDDYETHDGTGIRDYVHVLDLAEGHICALRAILKLDGAHIWNLGTGKGYSVLEVIASFEKASHQKIPYKIFPRRAGDLGTCFANVSKALRELGWKAKFELDDMMVDTWHHHTTVAKTTEIGG